MNRTSLKGKKWELALGLSAGCYFLFAYLQMRGLGIPNVFYSLFKVVMLLFGLTSLTHIRKNKSMMYLMIAFVVYTLLSGVVYIFNGKPFSLFYDALSNYILPMFVFFIGMKTRDANAFLIPMVLALSLALVLTIIPYLSFSPWYIQYILDNRNDTDIVGENYLLSNLRFSGVATSAYFIMYMCVPILSYCLALTVLYKKRNIVLYIVSILCIVSLILCQQRTAILFVALAILYFFVFLGKNNRKSTIVVLVLLAALIFILPTYVERFDDLVGLVTGRVENMSFETAFVDERQDKVTQVFSVWGNPIFGDGVGVYSHAAFYAGYVSVNDCAWIKLLVENGVVGVLLFLAIVGKSLIRGFKLRKHYYTELFIIVFYMVAMIGSDSLSMQTTFSVFFWFALGKIWNPIQDADLRGDLQVSH